MTKFCILFLSLSHLAFSQRPDWISKPKEQWPPIAMINEVWYKNGERYIHPSFEYAATGFLINTGTATLAVTAKHVLWVAKTKSMNAVDLQDNLQRWIMHPKGNLQDSVVIDKLINTDSTEKLNGPGSTITQRDWILFTTKCVSPNIQPLIPRYTAVKKGERIWYLGCPYDEKTCVIEESRVLEVEGNRIIFSMRKGASVGGASGSPLIDESGLLIGILGGSSVSKSSEVALYAISTRYLKKVLTHEEPLNVPLIPIGDVLRPIILEYGIDEGLQRFKTLERERNNFFVYDFSSEKINSLADDFLNDKKTDWAIAIYKLSLKKLSLSGTYVKLAKAYVEKGDRKPAIEALKEALKLWSENKEASEELKKLESN